MRSTSYPLAVKLRSIVLSLLTTNATQVFPLPLTPYRLHKEEQVEKKYDKETTEAKEKSAIHFV